MESGMVRDSVSEAAKGARPRRHRLPPRRGAIVAIAIPVALGIALLVLSVPRTIAAWEALAARSVLDELAVGKSTPSDAALADGVGGLKRAISWVPSSARLADLAFLEVEQVLRLPPSNPERAVLLASAERHLVDSLAANPADGFAWLRLAVVREQIGAPPREVAEALAQSLDMAPNTRSLWLPRATLLLRYWRYLTVDELLAMRAQLRTIWTFGKAMRLSLFIAADRLGEAPMISWGIGDDPAGQAEFEELRNVQSKSGSR
jgi:hypothetical protein